MYQKFPPAVTYGANGTVHSWRIFLLPFLERQQLYERYSFDEPWDGPNNSKLASEMPEFYCFAGTHQPGQSTSTNFVAIVGDETMWPPGKQLRYRDVNDLHSATIHFAEYNGDPIHWMSPVDLGFSTMSFQAGDPNGIDSQYLEPAVAMIDGSVKRLSDDVTPAELRAMCTANSNDDGPVPTHVQEMQDARMRQLKGQN